MPEVDPRTGLRKGVTAVPIDPRTGTPAQSGGGEFRKGLHAGLDQLSSISSGVEGAARAFAGDNEGADAATVESEQFQQKAQQFGPRIQNVDEVNDIDSFTDWAAGAIGQQIPIMGSMLAGGPVSLGARGVVGMATRAALPTAARTATGGMVAGASALETGSIFPELNSDPVVRADTTPRERAATALGFGTVAGSLEALPFIGITKRFGVDKAATAAIKKSVAGSIAKGTLTQAALEAGTEGAQTIVERSAHKFLNDNADIFSEEGLSEMRNAIATGGLLGGGIGFGGGAVQAGIAKGSGSFDAISDKIAEFDANDQLGGARVKRVFEDLKTKYQDKPDVSSEIDAVLNSDLQDPDVRDNAIKLSHALTGLSNVEDVLVDRVTRDRVTKAIASMRGISDADKQNIIENSGALRRLAKADERIDDAQIGALQELFDAPLNYIAGTMRALEENNPGIFDMSGITQDVGAIYDLSENPELLDQKTSSQKALTGRYGDLIDILDEVHVRGNPQAENEQFAGGEAGLTGFENESGEQEGATLKKDYERAPEFMTNTDFRIKKNAGDQFKFGEALSSSAADAQLGNLKDDATGIGITDADQTDVASGGFVFTKMPLSEAVVESRKVGQTNSRRVRDDKGVLTQAQPELISEGGTKSATDIQAEAVAEILEAHPTAKAMWSAVKPSENAAFDSAKMAELKDASINDHKKFLSNFFVIRKQKMSKTGEPIPAASQEDVTVTLTPTDVKQTSDKKIAKSIIRTQRGSQHSSRAATEVPIVKKSRKAFVKDKDGRAVMRRLETSDTKNPKNVNFAALVSRTLTLMSQADTALGTANVRNISKGFVEGVSSLATDHGLFIENLNELNDKTIVFYHQDGKTTTLGDVRRHIANSTEKRRAKKNFRVPIEVGNRQYDAAIEDKFHKLFEANKGRDEGDLLTLEDIGEGDLQSFIEAQLAFSDTRAPTPTATKRTVRTSSAKLRAKTAKLKKAKLPKEKTVAKVQKPSTEGAAINRRAKQDKPVMPSTQQTFQKFKKKLGVRTVKLITPSEAAMIAKLQGRADLVDTNAFGEPVIKSSVNGFQSGTNIYVNPRLTQAEQLEVLGHEMGHVVFMLFVKNNSGAINATIVDAFNKWKKSQKGSKTVADVMKSKSPLHLMVRSIELDGNKALADLNKDELQYLMDFEEWFADNTARFLVDETVVPKNAVERFFKQLVLKLRKLLKDFKGDPDKQVAKFLTELQHSAASRTSDAAAAKQSKDARKRFTGIKMSKSTKGFFEDGLGLDAYIAQKDVNDIAARSAIARWISVKLTQQERAVLTNAFKVPHVRAKIEEFTGSMADAPLSSLAAGVQLWNAGIINVGPKTDTVLQKFLTWIKKLIMVNTTENKAEHIMSAMIDADANWGIDNRSFHLAQTYRTELTARVADTFLEYSLKAAGYIQAYTYTADSRMQDNPALQEIAKLFHARVGNEAGTATTYFEARAINVGKFTDRVERILEGMDEQSKLRILNDGQAKYTTKLSKEERERSVALQKLFDDMYKYADSNGVATMVSGKDADGLPLKHIDPIKYRQKYFPVVYDTQYIMDNRAEFIEMLSQPKYARRFSENATPDMLYTHLIENMGYGDTPMNTSDNRVGFTPAMSAVNQRTLDWIDGKDKAPFLNKSLEYTMVQYIDSLVKRAEYTKRFDTDGRHLEQLLAKAKDSGATDAQMKMAENYVNAALGTLGKETNNQVTKLFGLSTTPGQVIHPGLQKAMSSVIVFRNLAVLGLSMFTSMADVVGITVRSGDLESSWQAYTQGLEEIQNGIKNFGRKDGKLARSEMSELARGLGVIDTHMTNEALEFQYGGTYMSSKLKKVNEAFFRAIGLTQLTKMTRVMALASAKNFIKKHSDGKYKHSERFMEELGLQKGDATFDSKGNLNVLTRHGRELLETEANNGDEVAAAQLARDDRVRTALFRWVDGAILRPNAAQRPIWASDPHYMLFFHLKSFMYSMHDRILRRAWTEFSKHGNLAPAMGVMMYVPAMIAIDAARDWIKFGFDGSPRKANWGFEDYTANAINRSGIAGVGSMMIWDAQSDRDFGGTGLSPQFGALEYPTQVATGVLNGNSNDIMKSLPGASVWRSWTQ